MEQEAVDLTILGNEAEVKSLISKLNLSIDTEKTPIIDPARSEYFDRFIDRYVEIRKNKGATKDNAKDAITDVSYFGTMMVLEGIADGMVSGAAHTTQHTIRPALQLIKTKADVVNTVVITAIQAQENKRA